MEVNGKLIGIVALGACLGGVLYVVYQAMIRPTILRTVSTISLGGTQ